MVYTHKENENKVGLIIWFTNCSREISQLKKKKILIHFSAYTHSKLHLNVLVCIKVGKPDKNSVLMYVNVLKYKFEISENWLHFFLLF